MRSVDAVLNLYFTLRDGGMVSAVDPSAVGSGAAQDPPTWLVRQCEVGVALAKLPPSYRRAVVRRWQLHLEADKHDRTAGAIEGKARRCRLDADRHRSGDQAERGRLLHQANILDKLATRFKRCRTDLLDCCIELESSRYYREGMALLAEILEERGQLTGFDPPAMTEEQVQAFQLEFARAVVKMLKSRNGGYARAAALTPERRSEIARQAARERWQWQ